MIIDTYLAVENNTIDVNQLKPGDIYLIDKYKITTDDNYILFIKLSLVKSRVLGYEEVVSIPNDKNHIRVSFQVYKCELVFR